MDSSYPSTSSMDYHASKWFLTLIRNFILTSGDPWDPTVIDNHFASNPNWPEIITDLNKGDLHYPFDEHGNYKKREPARKNTDIPPPTSQESKCYNNGVTHKKKG